MLVFLAETKAGINRIKGVQRKLEYSQGIIVPSDGRSGGLALLWKEGTMVDFKSSSNSHIDVVVRDSPSSEPWRATGFYGHPETNKRYISWHLLDSLSSQCNMPWVVMGDFNEILFSDEKLGGAEREAKQMVAFRERLNRCRLVDLGFIGQKYTWCNGRFGGERTKLRLDRVVANDDWIQRFPDARVFHTHLTISDHCLLKLSLKRDQIKHPQKRRFMFEAMWTRDTSCREVVEAAWDFGNLPSFQLTGRLRKCKEMLKRWNWREFGNVTQIIKQKREQLQYLESFNSLHEKADEVLQLKMEINEILTREEIMWNQRSRTMWMKWGDRNTKFFHATAS
ncbi:hypothetical protein SO802_007639 [Lithocarpus litseifolius]|uniref:Endonuclease/exonuclease/phosphatase domain-containing protein n=1 Tax=Lithocarpus litseifolius TaxID=425828 RepID=A0AAW2DUV7_9ROSI